MQTTEDKKQLYSKADLAEYFSYKDIQRKYEFVLLKKKYLQSELHNLQRELHFAKNELNRLKSVPLHTGTFVEAINYDTAIITTHTGYNSVVKILSSVNRDELKPNTSVALHRHSNTIVSILPPESDTNVKLVDQKPTVTYADVGGLDLQKQELRETIELPLVEYDMYQQIGIDPPRGVLLYGPPGTGKTMLVKAVANHANASFIKVNGSEFVQKYLGEGPRMVRDVFRLARENSPCIVFIDEIDSIATKRYDAATSADREVQRVLLELLNQMDGFDQSNVKVIMATNRPDTIDPALLRPGRLDRKIEFPLPDRRQKRLVFNTITSKMGLSEDVDLEKLIDRPDNISCADINSICSEAGMLAIRAGRYTINMSDFEEGYAKTIERRATVHAFYS